MTPRVATGGGAPDVTQRFARASRSAGAAGKHAAPAVPRALLEAWNLALREWDWYGPATLECNVGLIRRHYKVTEGVSWYPPPGLVAEWQGDGRPNPSGWIAAKLASLLGCPLQPATLPPALHRNGTTG